MLMKLLMLRIVGVVMVGLVGGVEDSDGTRGGGRSNW